MEQDRQVPLLEIPEQPVASKDPPPPVPAKLKPIDRSQGVLRAVIVEELVGPDHKVRAIWDLTGQLDLNGFAEKIVSRQGQAGRAAWDPRLLLSVWLYGYSEQVTSGREIERLMEYEPGLMWLAGLGEVNHHTLSDFRVEHQKELKQLLGELLGVLSQEGLVKLECVAHDGTKIRTQGGRGAFRREGTLEKEIAKAQQMVEELEQPGAAEQEGGSKRREAARRRAAKERAERMQQAAEELKKIRAGKDTEEERQEARVSLTEPEARIMKHARDQALAPSYNVQISTDTESKIIVGVHLTQCGNDSGSLLPAMEEMKATAGQYPKQVVADGDFTNRASIVEMKKKQIEFYGALGEPKVQHTAALKAAGIDPAFGPTAFVVITEKQALRCPAGQTLKYVRQLQKRNSIYHLYQAQGSDCGPCEFQQRCCPKHSAQGRMVSLRIAEPADVAEFRDKMKGEAAQTIYKKRGNAEFPNCWIKEKLGMRRFRLRGMARATTEAIWGVLTYDVMQWVRLSWRPKLAARLEVVTAMA